MSGISIGIKEPEFPAWVDNIYDNMTQEDRKRNTKANIYGCCRKIKEGYRIIPFMAGLSNRVPVLPDANSVATAIILADTIYPWSYLPGQNIIKTICKHCGFKFETPHTENNIRCPFCKKWDWQALSEQEKNG